MADETERSGADNGGWLLLLAIIDNPTWGTYAWPGMELHGLLILQLHCSTHFFSMVTSRVRWNEISRQHLSLRSINSNKTICFTEERTTLIQATPYGLLCEKRPETSCNSAPRHPFITLRQMAQQWHICTNNYLKSWWCTAGGRPSCWPPSMIYAVHFQKLGH